MILLRAARPSFLILRTYKNFVNTKFINQNVFSWADRFKLVLLSPKQNNSSILILTLQSLGAALTGGYLLTTRIMNVDYDGINENQLEIQ